MAVCSVIEQNHAVYRDVLSVAGVEINSEILLKYHHLSDPVYTTSDTEFYPDNSDSVESRTNAHARLPR